jgi:Tfp pilus assembly protein FimV
MSRPRRKPSASIARYAAPAAFLLAVTIAVLLIRAGLGGGDATTTGQDPGSRPAATTATTATRRTRTTAARFYTVVAGDTFGSISGKTGVSIDRLQQLNPGVSSNALRVGQRLRVK